MNKNDYKKLILDLKLSKKPKAEDLKAFYKDVDKVGKIVEEDVKLYKKEINTLSTKDIDKVVAHLSKLTDIYLTSVDNTSVLISSIIHGDKISTKNINKAAEFFVNEVVTESERVREVLFILFDNIKLIDENF